jgi:hypothetical protein
LLSRRGRIRRDEALRRCRAVRPEGGGPPACDRTGGVAEGRHGDRRETHDKRGRGHGNAEERPTEAGHRIREQRFRCQRLLGLEACPVDDLEELPLAALSRGGVQEQAPRRLRLGLCVGAERVRESLPEGRVGEAEPVEEREHADHGGVPPPSRCPTVPLQPSCAALGCDGSTTRTDVVGVAEWTRAWRAAAGLTPPALSITITVDLPLTNHRRTAIKIRATTGKDTVTELVAPQRSCPGTPQPGGSAADADRGRRWCRPERRATAASLDVDRRAGTEVSDRPAKRTTVAALAPRLAPPTPPAAGTSAARERASIASPRRGVSERQRAMTECRNVRADASRRRRLRSPGIARTFVGPWTRAHGPCSRSVLSQENSTVTYLHVNLY